MIELIKTILEFLNKQKKNSLVVMCVIISALITGVSWSYYAIPIIESKIKVERVYQDSLSREKDHTDELILKGIEEMSKNIDNLRTDIRDLRNKP